jgi:chaperone required for assembly of F1-ATPase
VSGWQKKRFWKEVSVVAEAGGFGLRLDGRVLRTPGKAPLVVPGAALAEAVAAEWRAQDGVIDPGAMPFTRMSNSAIEKVAPDAGAVARIVADYGASDLTCYRADAPAELVARQTAWDPMLDWAAAALGARLVPTVGVMPVPQDGAALERLAAAVRALNPFELAAFHDLVALSGSLILGLALVRNRLDVPQAWRLSRIDEDWQAGVWGIDAEAKAVADRKFSDFGFAKAYFDLARNG